MDDHHAEEVHLVPYRTYVNVWLGLVVLTVITVGASMLNLGHLAVFTAVLIAAVKCTLVLMYFMHLRYENKVFTIMLLATIFTYAIFVILTFADYVYR